MMSTDELAHRLIQRVDPSPQNLPRDPRHCAISVSRSLILEKELGCTSFAGTLIPKPH